MKNTKSLQFEQFKQNRQQKINEPEHFERVSTQRRIISLSSPLKVLQDNTSNQINSPSSINEDVEIIRKRYTSDANDKGLSYIIDSRNTDY